MSDRSELIENILTNNNQITSLQIVFVDIVKYSARSVASQRDVLKRFMDCLKVSLKDLPSLSDDLSTLVGRHPDFYASIIKLPTGDGAAIAFPFDAVADLHLLFARRLLKEVVTLNGLTRCPAFEKEQWCDCHPNFHLRVGVSAGGDCIIYRDVNENYNVAGTVINLAARVMDLADGEQIIFTDQAYKKLTTIKPALKPLFRPLEHVRIKGAFITAHQYVGEEEPYINRRHSMEVYMRGFPTKADLDEALGSALKNVVEHVDAGLGVVSSRAAAGFEELRRTLATSLSGRSLNDRESIYDSVIAAIREAKRYIKIVRLGSRAADTTIVQALAERVNRGVEYEIVVLLDQDDPSRGFMKNHRDILKQIHDDKVRYYHPYILRAEKPLCFDVLIVDDNYVGLGFTRLGAAEDLESAILLQDTTDKIARHFREWFDRVVKPRAEGL